MGEKGIEPPVAGTGAGALPGLMVAGGPSPGIRDAVSGLVGGAPTGATAATGIPAIRTDVSLAPDSASAPDALEPPTG